MSILVPATPPLHRHYSCVNFIEPPATLSSVALSIVCLRGESNDFYTVQRHGASLQPFISYLHSLKLRLICIFHHLDIIQLHVDHHGC